MTNNYSFVSHLAMVAMFASAIYCPISAQTKFAPCSDELRAMLQQSAPQTVAETFPAADPLTSSRHAAPVKAPEGDWKSLGEGVYFEDIMTYYSNVEKGTHWTVEVEESTDEPGWYRFKPYANPDNTLTKMNGQTDTETYFYLNATDPSKVYMENATVFNRYQITNFVPENNWPASSYTRYGTLEGGKIQFVYGAFGLYTSYGWMVSNAESGFKLYLPGTSIYDYSFEASAPFCVEDNQVKVTMKCGEHIAKVKVMYADGFFSATDENIAVVEQYGTETESLKSVTLTPEKNSIYTAILVALNAEGETVAATEVNFFGVYDESSKWQTMGKGVFYENLYGSAYEDVDPEELTVTFARSIDNPNRFRITDAYDTHSVLKTITLYHDDHHHYIYIDATRPDHAFIEASPLGVETQFGEGAVNSVAAAYNGTDYEDKVFENGYYGNFDTETGKITFPANSLFIAESKYENGQFMPIPGEVWFILPGYTAIESVEIESESCSPATYYNIMGQPIPAPLPGQIAICRDGKSARLIINK